MEGKNNLEIRGLGSVNSGKYHTVTVSGIGTLKGNIEGDVISNYGTERSEGKLEANTLIIAGDFTAEKDVMVKEELDIKGTASFKSKLNCTNLNIAGSLSVKDDLNFNSGSISGKLSLKNNCNAKKLSIIGSLDIENNLNIDNLSIGLMDKSFVTNIKGKNIEVKNLEDKSNKGLFKLLKGKVILKCYNLEGEDIYVENVECSLIRGNNVIIGPGCNIENIEYENKFQANQGSQVKSITCTKDN